MSKGYAGDHERALRSQARRERNKLSKDNEMQAKQIEAMESRLTQQGKNQRAAAAQPQPKPKPKDDMVIKQRPAENDSKKSEAKERAQNYKGSSFKQNYMNSSNNNNNAPESQPSAYSNFKTKQPTGMDMSKYQFDAGN